MNSRVHPRRSATWGFTLVELLISISILSIMLLALATMMGFVSKIWVNGIGNVDNFNKARVMLSMIDRDVQMMVMRRDIAAFTDSTGSTSGNPPVCAFYTKIQGYPGSDARTVSLVQYALNSSASSSYLSRNNYGMNFTSIAPTTGNTTSLPQISNFGSNSAVTETISTGVIAFGFQFVDGTGTILTPSPTNGTYVPTVLPPDTALPAKRFYYNYSAPSAYYNPRTLIISMAVMSNSAYNLATLNGTLLGTSGSLATTFPMTAPSNNQTYSQAWNSVINATTFSTQVPQQPIRTGIQIFERHIPLPVTAPTS